MGCVSSTPTDTVSYRDIEKYTDTTCTDRMTARRRLEKSPRQPFLIYNVSTLSSANMGDYDSVVLSTRNISYRNQADPNGIIYVEYIVERRKVSLVIQDQQQKHRNAGADDVPLALGSQWSFDEFVTHYNSLGELIHFLTVVPIPSMPKPQTENVIFGEPQPDNNDPSFQKRDYQSFDKRAHTPSLCHATQKHYSNNVKNSLANLFSYTEQQEQASQHERQYFQNNQYLSAAVDFQNNQYEDGRFVLVSPAVIPSREDKAKKIAEPVEEVDNAELDQVDETPEGYGEEPGGQ